MLNVCLAGDHQYGKLLFTWLSLVMSMIVSICAVPFPHEIPLGSIGCCDGTWYTSSAGASNNLEYSRARAYCAGGGYLGIFTLIYHVSPLSSILWETARYRLKYCLKGPLNPKQPTNQPMRCLGWVLDLIESVSEGFPTYSSAPTCARGRGRCCTFHYWSWADSIKSSLLFPFLWCSPCLQRT